ncbi:uncharacterized protein J8A68_004442 [[Candida] subhashii]|uniref:Uncharacterized protein n=1 Tax=[Candida] subhashii TaxID=561895 RepID=A0A8J5Q650_9ASCO|nr:uncharacterized protein J8A68_004442 [[Candida] subhashii]KAG7662054.1 hypothetical protein J8A68_004442 [[Candida] subhashii]
MGSKYIQMSGDDSNNRKSQNSIEVFDDRRIDPVGLEFKDSVYSISTTVFENGGIDPARLESKYPVRL